MCEWCVVHRDLHVLTHSFPSRRSSDLLPGTAQSVAIPPELGAVGLNAHEGAAAIPELVHLGLGLRCFHLARREKVECCECHVYNASKSARYTLHYTHEHWICPAVSSAQKIFNPLKTWT